jgi:5-methylcytosine-specific restriction endonuclease McrA
MITRDTQGRIVGGHWREAKAYYDAEWLRTEYVDKQRSTGEIAAEFGVTDAAILFWLKKHGIPRRRISEARAIKRWGAVGPANPMYGRIGALNPNYKDGSSPERQRLYASGEGRELIRAVYRRDDYRCQSCGARKSGPRSIHAHHVKPWAEFPALRFDLDNLITLCRSCHHAAHRKGGDAA